MTLIDAHQHFWRLDTPWHGWPGADLPAIHRDFLPSDLMPVLERHGISGSVLVQSQPSDGETDWLLDVAERAPEVLGVVGWADMTASDAPARIASLSARPKLKGLRPMLQDQPSDWILQPAALSALTAMRDYRLVFDALVRPHHLPAIAELGARAPDLVVVIDHAAKPDVAGGELVRWSDDLARVAALPNVVCKLSGLVTEAGAAWSTDTLAPVVETVLHRFGGNRVLWGSDWPVVLLAADYDDWLAAARSLVPEADHAAVFGGTAARVYRLELNEKERAT